MLNCISNSFPKFFLKYSKLVLCKIMLGFSCFLQISTSGNTNSLKLDALTSASLTAHLEAKNYCYN